MTTDPGAGLSAREREVMDVVYRLREVTTADVERELADPPSNATVRSILRTLEEKGWLTHRRDGVRYVYRPVESRERTRRLAVKHLVRTFFDGSVADAVAALVGRGDVLDEREQERLRELLEELEQDEAGGES